MAPNSDVPGEPHRLQGVLDDTRIVSGDRTPSVSMAVLAAVTDEELVRYGTQPGRVSATLHFTLTPSRVIGTLPLAARGITARVFDASRTCSTCSGVPMAAS